MFATRHMLCTVRQSATVLLAGFALLAAPALATDVFTNLNGALAGVSGDPLLQGSGTLQGGTFTTISLSNAAPNAAAALLISLTSNPVPFKGGVLQTIPIAVLIPLTTSPTGDIVVGTTISPALPTGLEFYLQYAIHDNAAVHGVALSNALRAHVPAPGPAISSFEPQTGSFGAPLTLTGAGFSSDPADVLVSVGGLIPFPMSGSPTSWTGSMPMIPAPDVLAETITIAVGNGTMVLPSPAPAFPGIKSSGHGQLWNGSVVQSFGTTSTFDKTQPPPDATLMFNVYAPNGVEFGGPQIHVVKVHLPLGTASWTGTAHVAYNFLFERSDGTAYAVSNDQLVPFAGPPAVCASIVAAFISQDLFNAGAPNTSVTATQVGSDWELTVDTSHEVPPVIQVCGSWAVWTS
jgi:IPT/TIG domain